MLLGFEKPSEGSLYYREKPVNVQVAWEVRREISYVSQDADLGEGTVGNLLDEIFSYRPNREKRNPEKFEARYLIPIGGMILGNSLSGNVLGIGEFYADIKRNENRYLYNLSLGASRYEALLPYIRKSLRSAVRPTLANIATAGVVFLPGMMTGQILGGVSPLLVIKY